MKFIVTSLLILGTLQALAQGAKPLYTGQDTAVASTQRHSIKEIQDCPLCTCCGYNIPIGGSAVINANRRGAGIVYVDGIALVQPNSVRPFSEVPGKYILNRGEISHMPTTQINDLISIFPGTYQARRRDGVSIYASRISGARYIIDGVRL